MKAWALGVSVALHLGLGLAVALAPSPPVVERVLVRGDAFISFTPVVVEPKPEVRAPPRRTAATRVEAVAPFIPSGVEGPADSAATPDPLPDTLSSAGAAEGLPLHLDPLPHGGEGDEVVALVHARLAAVADRCYPAAARRYQQRGTVQLSFCTNAQGGAATSEVTQSSGAELLDAAARGCVVENAAPFPLEAASRCFSVPVRFGGRP